MAVMANVAKGHDLNNWTDSYVAGYQPRSVNGRGSAPAAPVWASRSTRRFLASRCTQSKPEAAESASGWPATSRCRARGSGRNQEYCVRA
jgi:hypothetical protein